LADNKIELVLFSSFEEEYDVGYISENVSEIPIPSTSTMTSVKRFKIN